MNDKEKNEYELITIIAKRTLQIFREMEIDPSLDQQDIAISLHLCNEFCPLDLERFAKGEPFHIVHDILGILRHLNHNTGLLEDCFVPRFAKYEEQIDWVDDPEVLI